MVYWCVAVSVYRDKSKVPVGVVVDDQRNVNGQLMIRRSRSCRVHLVQ